MKRKEEKRLRLGKLTIQDLDTGHTVLDTDEQKRIKGGSDNAQQGTTQVPIFC
jgi:hypothetical protein